jgi:hypothetical protein
MKLDAGSNLEPFQSLVRDWRAKANEMTDAGDLGPLARVVVEQLLIRADDLEHTIRRTRTEDPAPRRIYPAESDPAALRVDISPTGTARRRDRSDRRSEIRRRARTPGADRHVSGASRSTRPAAARRAC